MRTTNGPARRALSGVPFELWIGCGAILLLFVVTLVTLTLAQSNFEAARALGATEGEVAMLASQPAGKSERVTEYGVTLSANAMPEPWIKAVVPDHWSCRGAIAALAPRSDEVVAGRMLFRDDALQPRTRTVGGRFPREETFYRAEVACLDGMYPMEIVGRLRRG